MRPKRLICRAKSAQYLFDEAVYRIFADIPRCLKQRDDILLGGRNLKEHNKTLEAVLHKASDFSITFNPDKCQFGVEEFYGHQSTKHGLKHNPDKVRAIEDASPPALKEAVRRFLGITGYLSRFIPRYSSLIAPLIELTHKDTKFKWEMEENEVFEVKGKQRRAQSPSSTHRDKSFSEQRPAIMRGCPLYCFSRQTGVFAQCTSSAAPRRKQKRDIARRKRMH